MEAEDLLARLDAIGAIITGSHVVYASGRHGSVYVNKAVLYEHSLLTETTSTDLVAPYDPEGIDVVAGPTVGGVILAQWGAWHLSQRRSAGETLAVFAEEETVDGAKRRYFGRGYDDVVRGKRVLVVEDVVTTGGTLRQVIDAATALDAVIAGVSILCLRGGAEARERIGMPIRALLELPQESWAPEECPLCRAGVPVNTAVGKGKAFLAH
jgi:orotate phosphoribosyltransferase